jgi:hypothetical protein
LPRRQPMRYDLRLDAQHAGNFNATLEGMGVARRG